MAPLIIAERRSILFLSDLITDIVWFHQLDHIEAFGMALLHNTSTVFCATFTIANVPV